MMGPTCMEKTGYLCFCMAWDKERSYLYIRENSLEANISRNYCCCIPGYMSVDTTWVTYLDRHPFRSNKCVNCLCCASGEPRAEIIEPGRMCCCIHCPCSLCNRRKVVMVPFQTYHCCRDNHVTWCHNCCGCCGKPSGNPLFTVDIVPQPKDADLFVQKLNEVLGVPGQEKMGGQEI